jgi:hypothetical protein
VGRPLRRGHQQGERAQADDRGGEAPRGRRSEQQPEVSGPHRIRGHHKDVITIEVYNEAGQLALAYNVFRCWVSEFQALPDLDANANAVAIQHIKLENEGWERDYTVQEPKEPTSTEPGVP